MKNIIHKNIKLILSFIIIISIFTQKKMIAQDMCSDPYEAYPDEDCESDYLYTNIGIYWIHFTSNDFENLNLFVTSETTIINSMILYTGDCKDLELVLENNNPSDSIFLFPDNIILEEDYYIFIEFEDERAEFEFKICNKGCNLIYSPNPPIICTIGDPIYFDFSDVEINFPFGYIEAWTTPTGIDPNITGTSQQNPSILYQQNFTAFPQVSGYNNYYTFWYYIAGEPISPCQWTINVIVEPTPIPTFTTNYFNTCHGTPPITTHYITSTMQDITYTYQIGNGTPQAITTNPFDVDWTGNEDGGILYINAVNNFYGCPKKDSVKIFSCCNGPTDTHYNDETLTSSPQGNFTINGVLTIDGTVSFTNKEIYFGPDAKIIINPNRTLNITGCTLEAYCDTMWDGIYISGTAQLNVENSVISDAKNAVVSQDGGDFQISNETKFQNNYKGIVMEAFDDAHPGSITETTFLFDPAKPWFPQYPQVTASRTFSGIELYDVLDDNSYFEIGESASGMMNYFDNMDYGIIAYRSKIKVINNTFTDISYQAGAESAIILQGFDDSNDSKAIIGGFNTYDKNIFEDVCFGVTALQNMDIDILNNEFTQPYYGILIHDAAEDNTVSINSNTIDYPVFVGIWGNNNEWCNTEILGNEITMSGTGWFGMGIVLGEQVPDNANAYYEVGGNTISAPVVNGISGTNLQSPLIANNVVTAIAPTSASRIGITLSNCDEAEVTGNGVYYTTSSSYNTNGGLYMSLSGNALVDCNNFWDAGYGIRCDGTMIGTFKRNEMRRNDRGLWLNNAGEIGPQGSPPSPGLNHYNKWVSSVTWDTYTSGGSDGDDSPFYVRDNIPAENPQLHHAEDPLQDVDIPFDPSGNYSNPLSCDPSPLMGGIIGSTLNTSFSESVASGIKQFPNTEAEWLAKHAVYKNLLKDTANVLQITQNNILQNFKDSVAQAAMGKLEEVNTQLAQSNVSQMQLQSLYAYNQNIAVMNDMEKNWQAVNDIIIDVKVNNKKKPDSLQLELLKELAWKCPFIDGKSVYQARTMLSYYDDITVVYFNACEYVVANDTKRMEQENENNNESVVGPTIKTYPNPASDMIFVEIIGYEFLNAEFKLYNALGQEVLSQINKEYSKNMIINLSNVKAGFYNYKFIIDNKVISSDKLIILK